MTKQTKPVEVKAPPVGSYTIEVDGKKCYLKQPDRGVFERVIGLITPMTGQQPQLIKAGSIILNSCWIDGDPEIKTDDSLNLPASLKAIELLELKEASLKKN